MKLKGSVHADPFNSRSKKANEAFREFIKLFCERMESLGDAERINGVRPLLFFTTVV